MPLHYLAYGSNLHPLRLLERVPSSRLLGKLALSGYRLAFHKLGQDGSGKCNLVASGNDADTIHAALFELDAGEKALLDGFEGEGYAVEEWQIDWNGKGIRPFVYIAEPAWIDDSLLPYQWYRDIVGLGASYLQLPPAYVETILGQASIPDPDEERHLKHQGLMQRMRNWSADQD